MEHAGDLCQNQQRSDVDTKLLVFAPSTNAHGSRKSQRLLRNSGALARCPEETLKRRSSEVSGAAHRIVTIIAQERLRA